MRRKGRCHVTASGEAGLTCDGALYEAGGYVFSVPFPGVKLVSQRNAEFDL